MPLNLGCKTQQMFIAQDFNAKIAEHAELIRLISQIKLQHSETINIILQDKNAEIESLKQELFTVHINERIKNINLHEKIKLLTNNIKQFATTVLPNKGVK